MTDRVLLISSDCHGGPRPDDYRPYLESTYHEDLDRYLEEKSLLAEMAPKNRAGMLHEREHRITFGTQLESRLLDLEGEGIVGEVIFPDGSAGNEIPFTGAFGGTGRHSRELQSAALRAYNRWMGEHSAPNRQIGLALVPLHDPDAAVEMVKHARGMCLLGVFPIFDGADPNEPQLYDERLNPVWVACAENHLPVSFHGGSGIPLRLYDSKAGFHVLGQEIEFWSHRVLWQMILGGVLERFPELRVGLTEVHSDWIASALARMDRQWDPPANATGAVLDGYTGASLRDICPRKPSEYFAEQFHVGASALSWHEIETRHEVGVGNMMFGTDHPHSAASWGCTREYLQLTFGAAGVPEKETRLILGENIADLYGLDRSKLEPIVERVGLGIDEVLRRPDDRTDEQIPEGIRSRVHAMVERQPD